MCTAAKLKIITAAVVKSVLLVSDKVEKIILFGSQSRGDSTAESDIDILVVVDEPSEDIYDLKKLIWKHTNDISLQYDEVISLIMKSVSEYDKMRNTLFYENVAREGIELYGRAS